MNTISTRYGEFSADDRGVPDSETVALALLWGDMGVRLTTSPAVAAALLDVSYTTAVRMCREGTLEGFPVGRGSGSSHRVLVRPLLERLRIDHDEVHQTAWNLALANGENPASWMPEPPDAATDAAA